MVISVPKIFINGQFYFNLSSKMWAHVFLYQHLHITFFSNNTIWFLRSTSSITYANLVSSSSDNAWRLWQTLNKLLHRKSLNLHLYLLPLLSLFLNSKSQMLFNCPSKQSNSDPIPTWLLKECSALLVPTVTNIVNLLSLHHTLRESVISPLLKKPTLDKWMNSLITNQSPTSLLYQQ